MKTKYWSSIFVLTEIPHFDARRGYKKCDMPGVGASHVGDRRIAHAHFWRDRSNNVVARFTCTEYQYSFEARLASGATIPENQMEDFGTYVSEVLALWLVEGVDDNPSTEI